MEQQELRAAQELLLDTFPLWHHHLVRPLKHLLQEKMSLGTYHCLQTLRRSEGMMTMTELARSLHAPKQRVTKLVDQLVERGFVERIDDPADRRITRLRVTDAAGDDVDRFLQEETSYVGALLESMSEPDRKAFCASLASIRDILEKLPVEGCVPPCERDGKGGMP